MTEPMTAGAARPERLDSERAALWAHVALTIFGFAYLVWVNRHQGFLTEDWVYFTRNRPHLVDGDVAEFLFEQYRGHWITTTNVLFEGAFQVAGLRSYVPYLLPTALATTGSSVLLRVVMRRAGVGPWLATGLAAVALVLSVGAENVARAWQIPFSLAMLLGLAQLLLTDHDGPVGRRDVLGLAAGLLGLMTSGVALVFVFVTGLNLGLRRRWLAVVVDVIPLGVVYAVWYAAYGSAWPDSERASPGQAGVVLERTWTALTRTVGGIGALEGAGAALVLLLVVAALLLAVPVLAPRVSAATSLAVGAPVFFLFAGYASYSSFELLPDRYLHLASFMVVPLIGVVGATLLERVPWARVVVVVALLWMIVANAALLHSATGGYVGVSRVTEPQVLAMAALPELASLRPDAHLQEPLINGITAATLLDLRRGGAFGDRLDHIEPAVGLSVATELLVTLEQAGGEPPRARLRLAGQAGAAVRPDAGGCLAVEATSRDPQVSVTGSGPARMRVTSTFGGPLGVEVTEPGVEGAATKGFDLAPGVDYTLGVGMRRDIVLTLRPPDRGVTTLCGVIAAAD